MAQMTCVVDGLLVSGRAYEPIVQIGEDGFFLQRRKVIGPYLKHKAKKLLVLSAQEIKHL